MPEEITLSKFLKWKIGKQFRIMRVFSRGSNFDFIFLFFILLADEGRGSNKRAIGGQSAKRHLSAVLLACRCWPNIEC